MKKYKNYNHANVQELSRTVRIYGNEFTVDMEGYVSTRECGRIGHIEDCRDFAKLIHDLIDIFDQDGEI